ncbi:hypothetical protein COU58_04135 [Candidatus Pacearchaeota archaeon CG10_big_fil_rev_8_21_14_0_10_32_42]|nr:MAG: hypothetical protein COU58_04135 [Candidatus Pacearchaeota archaeon CG10_big_fil_rev_8_21_14_0_10_32_42]
MEKTEETRFLKIDFNINPKEEIEKRVSFPNSEIKRVVFREKLGFFYEFIFKTIFEYLGKKDEVSNRIYIFNGKPIEGNLSEYTILEGDENEAKSQNYQNSYYVAKEELKKRVQLKTNEISNILTRNLEKEKEKIEKSFVSETRQFQEKLKGIAERLMEYAKKGDMEKISEQKKAIDSLKEKSNFWELEKDKLRAIQLENQKHILNIENRLEKTTIIYYPVYFFTMEIKKDEIKKSFTIEFDPISKEFNGLICENCSKKIKEVIICNSGHPVCRKCSSECQSCKKTYCKKCIKYVCELCSKKICKDCGVRCFRCSKLVCKNHVKKDKISGYSYCSNCLKRCIKCDNLKDPFSFKVSKKNNTEVCEDCFRNEAQENVLKGVFPK